MENILLNIAQRKNEFEFNTVNRGKQTLNRKKKYPSNDI